MFFFWRIMLAHFLADFTFQSNRIAAWKRESIAGVCFHVMIFAFFAAAINFEYLGDRRLLIALALMSALHVLEDEWRVLSIRLYNSPDDMLFFFWDQFIHILVIFAFFPPPPLNAATMLPLPVEKWVLIGCMFVLATHFSTVLIYFLKRGLFGDAQFPQKEKYHGIVERSLQWGIFILQDPYYLPALAILTALIFAERYTVSQKENGLDNTRLNLIASAGCGVLCSLASHWVYIHP